MKNIILIMVIFVQFVAGAWYDFISDLNKKFETWKSGDMKKDDLDDWEIEEN